MTDLDKNRSTAFGFLAEEMATSISLSRFDLSAFIAKRVPISIMHRSFESLRKIFEYQFLTVETLIDDHAVRVTGKIGRPEDGLFIDAVWVKAASSRYRDALNERDRRAGLVEEKLPRALHVDHIVNRASLSEMHEAKQIPWVMLFAVPAQANTNFGNSVERHLPKISADKGQEFLSAIHIFKLYTTDWPRNTAEFDKALDQIGAQIQRPDLIQEMDRELRPIFR
ncbi:TPA: hypothetical protein UM358_000499 [Stenotrophomonas maltophilia]|nr:hypothetical protein [Stenotrophomonas maltophilia]HEL4204066.1 hypothetical protein [Stenotrophomonas maltophilia]